jgi:glucan biosynthesis protein C
MKKERLYYVDWLRIFVILTLIPYHAALTYTNTNLGEIYIKAPIKDIRVLPYLVVMATLDNFFMTLLFFLSGVGTYYALQHRSKREYMKERTKKLFIPFLLGTILLCPIQAYTKGLYNGFSGNFLHFLPEFFSGKIVGYLGYAHLWFLLYLFIISMGCVSLFKKWLNNKTRLENLSLFLCKGKNILIPIGFICLSELLLRPFSGSQTLIGDWANDVVYPSMFIFGFVFASNTNIQKRVGKLFNPSKFVFFMCIPIYIFLYYKLDLNVSGVSFYGGVVLLKGIYECSAIIVLLEMGRKYLNKRSQRLDYLNKASFTYYVMHLLPVSIFTYYFVNTELNIYVKYILVLILSYAFIFVLYEFVVRRIFVRIEKKYSSQITL